jgi:hypothetical protein
MRGWPIFGVLAIAVLLAANLATALAAIGSSAADLSRLDVRNASSVVDLIPSSRSRAIPVRLRLHGGLWLSGFGRRDWFSGVIETDELQVLDWDRPWNGNAIRLTLRAERDELDPAAGIRLAFREGKAERLPDYEGLRTYRLVWHESSVSVHLLGEPDKDRFAGLDCTPHGCSTLIQFGPNLMGRLSFPDIRQNGGRDYANGLIEEIERKVCAMVAGALCGGEWRS